MSTASVPDILFIDTILFAYRLGHVRHKEQKVALLAATRAAKDAISFLTALENFGVGRQTELYRVVGEILSAPSFYRAQYPGMVGLRREGEAAASFLNNQYVLFLVEPVLDAKQRETFFGAYWWFVNNHQASYYDPRKGWIIGLYASEPQDNASTLLRFEAYLYRLANHKNKNVRDRYEGFPTDIVIAILRRAFT